MAMTQEPNEASIVYVVDDDTMVHRSMRWLLESEDYQVETFESGEAFLQAVSPSARGCLVLDIAMPGISGLRVQAEMNERGYSLPIIIVSGHGDIPDAVQSMQAGSLTFIQKPIDDAELVRWIAEAFAIDANRRERGERQMKEWEKYLKLTWRERQVLWLVIEGKPNKQVAGDLNLAEKTIEFHRANLMKKLQVYNLADLVRTAIEIEAVLKQRDLSREHDPRDAGEGRG
jgi:two-component system response regulator FixJ